MLYLALEDNVRRLNKRIGALLPFVERRDWPKPSTTPPPSHEARRPSAALRKWIKAARNPR